MTIDEVTRALNIYTDYIPEGSSNRPGTALYAHYITIHNTDNPDSGADAKSHSKYLKGEDAQARQVSWHYTVDDWSVYKHLPTSELGWHAGTSLGNNSSIGIEICEFDGIDQHEANDRAALLTALLCKTNNISIGGVVTHQSWSEKYCPHLILNDKVSGGFQGFVNRVKMHLGRIKS